MIIIDKKEIKERLATTQSQLKNNFGQNYLISPYGMNTFLQHLQEVDTIIEIGPGIGNISINYLHLAKRIFLIEIDAEKIPLLKEVLKDHNDGIFPNWVTIINDDVLTIDIQSLIEPGTSYDIIGALPYNIAKRIIHKTLQLFPVPRQAVFIVQKEVADKYVTEDIKETFLSVSSKLYAHIERKEILPPHYFYPAPKVRSRILKITNFIGTSENEIQEFEAISQFIKKGFSSPRKKLSNTLEFKNYTEDTIFVKEMRAEALSIDIWRRLYFSQI